MAEKKLEQVLQLLQEVRQLLKDFIEKYNISKNRLAVKDFLVGCTSFINKNKLYQKGVKSEILENMVILVDTREKKNDHILKYFDRYKINYEIKKLDVGDYSYYIKPNKYISQGLNAENIFTIDRKQDVNEIVGNIIQDRERFEKELLKASFKKMRFYLLIEEATVFDKILAGDYISKANANSVTNSLITFCDRYNIIPFNVSKNNAAKYIINMCRCNLSNELTEGSYASRWR